MALYVYDKMKWNEVRSEITTTYRSSNREFCVSCYEDIYKINYGILEICSFCC